MSAAAVSADGVSGPRTATFTVMTPRAASRSSAANARRSARSSPANSRAPRCSSRAIRSTAPSFSGRPSGTSSRTRLPPIRPSSVRRDRLERRLQHALGGIGVGRSAHVYGDRVTLGLDARPPDLCRPRARRPRPGPPGVPGAHPSRTGPRGARRGPRRATPAPRRSARRSRPRPGTGRRAGRARARAVADPRQLGPGDDGARVPSKSSSTPPRPSARTNPVSGSAIGAPIHHHGGYPSDDGPHG